MTCVEVRWALNDYGVLYDSTVRYVWQYGVLWQYDYCCMTLWVLYESTVTELCDSTLNVVW
jgi:hypothetical protein